MQKQSNELCRTRKGKKGGTGPVANVFAGPGTTAQRERGNEKWTLLAFVVATVFRSVVLQRLPLVRASTNQHNAYTGATTPLWKLGCHGEERAPALSAATSHPASYENAPLSPPQTFPRCLSERPFRRDLAGTLLVWETLCVESGCTPTPFPTFADLWCVRSAKHRFR